MRSFLTVTSIVACSLVGFSFNTGAVAQDVDTADDSAYDSSWSNGQNGGSGFGAWTLNGSTNAGFLTGSAADNGDGSGGAIDTGGRSWLMFANSGELAEAIRPFSTTIPVNGQVQVHMDNGWVQNGGAVGFALENASGEKVYEYYFGGGDSFYTSAGLSNDSTNTGFTADGLDLVFTRTGASTYSIDITPAAGGTTNTASGDLKSPAGGNDITRIRMYNFNAGPGTDYNAYFNFLRFSTTGGLPVELDQFSVE